MRVDFDCFVLATEERDAAAFVSSYKRAHAYNVCHQRVYIRGERRVLSCKICIFLFCGDRLCIDFLEGALESADLVDERAVLPRLLRLDSFAFADVGVERVPRGASHRFAIGRPRVKRGNPRPPLPNIN